MKRVAWDDLTVKIPPSWAFWGATVTLVILTGFTCALLLARNPMAWVFVLFSLVMATCREGIDGKL